MCAKMSVKTKWFASNCMFDTRQNTNVEEPLSIRAFTALIKNFQFSEMSSKLVEIAFENNTHKQNNFL